MIVEYTRSIVENELERNKLKERNEVLNLENDKQAQNYRELAEGKTSILSSSNKQLL